MAAVLAEHELTAAWLSVDAPSGFICMCGAHHEETYPTFHPRAAYAAHVADELTKAGYGIVPNVAPEYGARVMQFTGWSSEPHPQGPTPNPFWLNKSTHVRLVGPWQEIKELPDALKAGTNG